MSLLVLIGIIHSNKIKIDSQLTRLSKNSSYCRTDLNLRTLSSISRRKLLIKEFISSYILTKHFRDTFSTIKMSADSSRQIKQMVNFIMQEAHEKVNELKIKVLPLT